MSDASSSSGVVTSSPRPLSLILTFVAFGFFNNINYVVVIASAHTLSTFFGEEQNFGWLIWANIVGGVLVQLLNMYVLVEHRVSHTKRMYFVTAFNVIGLVGTAVASVVVDPQTNGHFGFWLSFCFILLIGSAAAFGESVVLGTVDLIGVSSDRVVDIIGAWGTGSGIGGIGGTMGYLVLNTFEWTILSKFLLFVPGALAYLALFIAIVEPKLFAAQKRDREDGDNGLGDIVEDGEKEGAEEEEEEPIRDAKKSGRISPAPTRTKATTAKVSWFRRLRSAWNLLLIYCFEYLIFTGCAERIFPTDTKFDAWQVRNSFEILAWCYQTGVFISRSSLKYARFNKLETLTALQFVCLLFWMFLAKWRMFSSPGLVWFLFPCMIFSGLLGGSSYVNGFLHVVEDPDLDRKQKELLVNVTSIFCAVGIALASSITVVLDRVFFDL